MSEEEVTKRGMEGRDSEGTAWGVVIKGARLNDSTGGRSRTLRDDDGIEWKARESLDREPCIGCARANQNRVKNENKCAKD